MEVNSNRYTIEFLGTWAVRIIPILKWSNLTTLELRNRGFEQKESELTCVLKYKSVPL